MNGNMGGWLVDTGAAVTSVERGAVSGKYINHEKKDDLSLVSVTGHILKIFEKTEVTFEYLRESSIVNWFI